MMILTNGVIFMICIIMQCIFEVSTFITEIQSLLISQYRIHVSLSFLNLSHSPQLRIFFTKHTTSTRGTKIDVKLFLTSMIF